MNKTKENVDELAIKHFGQEWTRFDQDLSQSELKELARNYFKIFPWDILPPDSIGFDMGCGSGRWASYVSTKVKKLICIDPSEEALIVAKRNLKNKKNCTFSIGSANINNLKDNYQDDMKNEDWMMVINQKRLLNIR